MEDGFSLARYTRALVFQEQEFIPFRELNVLPQCRDFFDQEGIEAFADGIATQGLINPILVARFDQDHLERYLTLVSELYRKRQTPVTIDRLVAHTGSDGERLWYVLIAGERRTRAHQHLWSTGCSECRERANKRHRPLMPGECYFSHEVLNKPDEAKELFLGASIEDNPDAYKALYKQLAENTHERVPPAREARVYSDLFRLLRSHFPKMAMAAFARRVGRSAQSIANALRYAELPEPVQQLVSEKNALSYLAALELARLCSLTDEEGRSLYSERRLYGVAEYIVSKGMDVASVKTYVRSLIAETRQTSFFHQQPSQDDLDRAASRARYLAAVRGLGQTMTVCRRSMDVQDLRPERRLGRLKKVLRERLSNAERLLDELATTRFATMTADREGVETYAQGLALELERLMREAEIGPGSEDGARGTGLIVRLRSLRGAASRSETQQAALTHAVA